MLYYAIGTTVIHLSLFFWAAKCVSIFGVLLQLLPSTILSIGVMSMQHSAHEGMCTYVSSTNLIHLSQTFK